jgi:hypothetical protein
MSVHCLLLDVLKQHSQSSQLVCAYLEESTIISLGCDCTVAIHLDKKGWRKKSYPFDWCISLGKVSNMFKTDFLDWCNMIPRASPHDRPTNKYLVNFCHEPQHEYPDKQKFDRRINRMKDLLHLSKSDYRGVVHLVRVSHKTEFHGGTPAWHGPCVSNDNDEIRDMIELDRYFKGFGSCYKIWLLLVCPICFQKCTHPAKTDTLEIINIVHLKSITTQTANADVNSRNWDFLETCNFF